jgi:hypothetical protein
MVYHDYTTEVIILSTSGVPMAHVTKLPFFFVSSLSLFACESTISTPDKSVEEWDTTEETEQQEQEENEQQEDEQDEPDLETEDQEEQDEPEDEGQSCTYTNFDIQASRAFVQGAGTDQPLFIYQAANTTEYPMDVLEVLSYSGDPYYGPDSPGNYSINGNNYSDCSLCLLIYVGCNETSCQSMFFADAGSVTFNTNADVNQDFSATLSNVVFREVSIDQDTYESTPIPGGDTWCVSSLSLSALPAAQ